jgi:hypothetical protein
MADRIAGLEKMLAGSLMEAGWSTVDGCSTLVDGPDSRPCRSSVCGGGPISAPSVLAGHLSKEMLARMLGSMSGGSHGIARVPTDSRKSIVISREVGDRSRLGRADNLSHDGV